MRGFDEDKHERIRMRAELQAARKVVEAARSAMHLGFGSPFGCVSIWPVLEKALAAYDAILKGKEGPG